VLTGIASSWNGTFTLTISTSPRPLNHEIRTLYIELDVPLTGISALQDSVGIPSFNTPFCEADHRGNQSSHFEAHYASQIALRRLCANMHNIIYECI
jgi:hypothetical protein